MNQNLVALYGLKWNPFSPDIPTEALWVPARIEAYLRRIESHTADGGFALVVGEPGSGKSVLLRLIADRFGRKRDVLVGTIGRPQSRLSDFYRELGDLFGVTLVPHNRWSGFRALREKWIAHVQSTLSRPVLLVDEAQEMHPSVLVELRILASAEFDSRALLTVVLAGDSRLSAALGTDELRPLASRIRSRIALEPLSPQELAELVRHLTAGAGNARLVGESLVTALSEHSLGNPRALLHAAAELLAAGAERNLTTLDEKLYFELVTPKAKASARRPAGARS